MSGALDRADSRVRHDAGFAGAIRGFADRVRSGDLSGRPAVIVASEEMDEDPGWRALESGELVHVDPSLNVTVTHAIDRPPAHQLTLKDLDPKAAASQGGAKRA